MARILIVFATVDGQTAKIASFIADEARRLEHTVDVFEASAMAPDFDVERYDAILVGAPVHAGRHPRSVRRFIAKHKAPLNRKTSAFFQVSLTSASHDEAHVTRAAKTVEALASETGWHPPRVGLFAGALLYSRYGWLKRLMMRAIAKRERGDTNTSRDYEYTDWLEVATFARAFCETLPRARSRETRPDMFEWSMR